MKRAIAAEICFARDSLTSLSPHDRRRLLRNIVEALDAIHDAAMASNLIADPVGIDQIIISTSRSIAELARLADREFEAVIEEFDRLFAKLSEMLLDKAPPASAEIH